MEKVEKAQCTEMYMPTTPLGQWILAVSTAVHGLQPSLFNSINLITVLKQADSVGSNTDPHAWFGGMIDPNLKLNVKPNDWFCPPCSKWMPKEVDVDTHLKEHHNMERV